MQKTQFTFGSTIESQKGMKDAKSLYSSGIDAQAKAWEPSANKEDNTKLKKTNFTIGDKTGSMGGSEAHA